MRVVHFCPDAAKASGVNTFCSKIDRALKDQGVDSQIVRAADTIIKKWNDSGCRTILHVHGLWLRKHHRVVAWARENAIPVVWSTHGMTAPWSMRHKWWKKLPAWWLYQKRDLNNAVVLHCTTELEVDWNKKLGFERCFVAPLGTDEGEVAAGSRRRAADGKTFVVLFVGRIYPVKGLANLVKAAALFRSNDRTIRFRIVGPDQAGHQAELMKLAGELDVAEMFEWPGPRFGQELSAEYENCDVLVLPSYTENFGGVVIDALAHGKPVIASKLTPWRILEGHRCGWWVDNTPESLASTLRTAIEQSNGPSNRTILEEMGSRGRALVASKYTWTAVAKTLVRAYEEVLKMRGNPRK